MNCPTCGSENIKLLGVMGRLRWCRCADCGMEFSKRLEDNEDPEQEDVP